MKLSLALLFVFAGLQVSAQNPSIVIIPTESEMEQYLSNKKLVHDVTSKCITNIWDTHLDFFKVNKVSKYYGDRNPLYFKRSQLVEALKSYGVPTSLVDELEPTSCIGLTRRCLKEGFYETKNLVLQNLWDRIEKNVIANGVSGVVLIQNLQAIGWKVLYWNPAPANNTKWDQEDVKNLTNVKVVNWDSGIKNAQGQFVYHSGWGMHTARYKQVLKSGKYYTVKVDDQTTLVNTGTKIPDSFKQANLFVGVAHAGYHVFPGMYGEVIEAHSMRALNSIDNLEKAPFNPIGGGSPKHTKSEKYRSGILAIPPH